MRLTYSEVGHEGQPFPKTAGFGKHLNPLRTSVHVAAHLIAGHGTYLELGQVAHPSLEGVGLAAQVYPKRCSLHVGAHLITGQGM